MPIVVHAAPAQTHALRISRPTTIRRGFAVACVVLLAATAGVAAHPAAAVTNCSASPSWGTNRGDLASQVVDLINQYRASIGLSRLSTSSPLTASSEWKSLHMASYGYFDHNDPAPPIARTAHQRALDCGYAGSWWGENIAWGYGSAQSVVNGWLGSAGHKANIENPNFSSTGVGVAANASGQLYWTQNFGNDAPSSTPSAPPPTPSPTPSAPTPAPAPPPVQPTTPTATAPVAPAAPTAPTTPPRATAPPARSATAPLVGAKRARVAQQGSRLTASVAFITMATGRPLVAASVRCRAEVNGKRLRVITNVLAAQAARCAWRLPVWASGEQLTGVVAVQVGDTATKRIFVRTIA